MKEINLNTGTIILYGVTLRKVEIDPKEICILKNERAVGFINTRDFELRHIKGSTYKIVKKC